MSNTVYLITGANRGVGLGTAQAILADSPSNFVIATAREPAKAGELQALAQESNGRLAVVKLDVSDVESVKAAKAEVEQLSFVKENGIDVLINNAGVVTGVSDLASELKAEDLDFTLRANLYGPILVTQAFVPLVLRSTLKKVVLVSSYAGSTTAQIHAFKPGDNGAYSISKAAANMYFVHLAQEFEHDGVRVVAYHPGTVDTPMMAGIEGYELHPILKAGELLLENTVRKTADKPIVFLSDKGEEIPW